MNLQFNPVCCALLVSLTAVGCAGPAQATTPANKVDAGTLRLEPCAPDGTDSLYRVGRELLNQGNYRNASQIFNQITTRHPQATCAGESLYWQAFSLYRLGTLQELRQARTALEMQRMRYPTVYLQGDARSLSQRIAGALAQQGDNSAMRSVVESARVKPTCNRNREELAVRVEALNALAQYDLATARPMMEKMLARHDECFQPLRRQVVFMLGRQQDAQAAKLLAQVVRSEPDASIRNDAILFLTRMPTDNTALLTDVLKSSNDPDVQQTVLRVLVANKSPESRKAIRSVLREEKVSPEVRDYAIQQMLADEASQEQADFMRALYPKVSDSRLKTQMVYVLATAGGSENQAWLLALVRNPEEPLDRRTQALQRTINLTTVKTGDIVKLYDKVPERELRRQLINFYAIRDESAATNKLMDIARSETDPQLLRYAIAALSGRSDPRTQKLLLEILDRK